MARLQKGAVGVYSAMQLAKGGSSMHGSSHLTPLTGTPQGKNACFNVSCMRIRDYELVKLQNTKFCM